MKVYLYRAVATEEIQPTDEPGDYGCYEGEPLGRMTGYLSRSSARQAGADSGRPHRVERSQSIQWGPPKKDRIHTLAAALADLVIAGNHMAAKAVADEIKNRMEADQ